jgi:hypothetical protein
VRKIENESFNTLKTKGYNLEHNFGHSMQHLSAVLAVLNLLVFTFDTVADLTHDLWLQSINQSGARSRFIRTIAIHHHFSGVSVLGRASRQPWLSRPTITTAMKKHQNENCYNQNPNLD